VDFDERQPGLSFIAPFVHSDLILDVREQRYLTVFEEGENQGKANAFVQSSDLQEITVRASLVYKPFPDQAAELVDMVGPYYLKQVIEPLFFDAIKEASGQCLPDEDGNCQRTALSFATQLGDIAEDIEAIIAPQLAERGIQVISVALEDAVFDPTFIQSVKEKVIANEEAKEQENLVAARAAEKQQTILTAEAEEQKRLIEARGERQAIEDIAGALGFSPEEYLSWLQLTRWNGALPSTLVGDAGDFSILLGVDGVPSGAE
jgi:prohibitin 2